VRFFSQIFYLYYDITETQKHILVWIQSAEILYMRDKLFCCIAFEN